MGSGLSLLHISGLTLFSFRLVSCCLLFEMVLNGGLVLLSISINLRFGLCEMGKGKGREGVAGCLYHAFLISGIYFSTNHPRLHVLLNLRDGGCHYMEGWMGGREGEV